MSNSFREASKECGKWLSIIRVVADLGKAGSADLAYCNLLPKPNEPPSWNLNDSYRTHVDVLNSNIEKLAAVSDGPITLSSVGWHVVHDVATPRYSSAHECSAKLAKTCLDMLVRPLTEIDLDPEDPKNFSASPIRDQKQQWEVAERSLKRYWKALAISDDIIATLQERIRRERAIVIDKGDPTLEDQKLDDREKINLDIDIAKQKLTIDGNEHETARSHRPRGDGMGRLGN